MVLQCDWAQIQVIVLHNDGHGFGFGISGSRNSGAVVRNIFPGGAADRDGTLKNGDHLLAVGEVRLWGMGAEQVASILRQAGQDSIRLVIARPVDPKTPQYAVNCVIVPTKNLSDPVELERALQSSFAAAAGTTANGTNGFAFESVEEMFPEPYQSGILPMSGVDHTCNQHPSATLVHPITVLTGDPTLTGTMESTVHNTVLPLTSSSQPVCETVSQASMVVTQVDYSSRPQVSIFSGDSAPVIDDPLPPITIPIPALPRSDMVIEIHNPETDTCDGKQETKTSPVGQAVTLVTSESNPEAVTVVTKSNSHSTLVRCNTVTEKSSKRQSSIKKKPLSIRSHHSRHSPSEVRSKRSRESGASNPSTPSSENLARKRCAGPGNCDSDDEMSMNLPLEQNSSPTDQLLTPVSPSAVSESLIPEKEFYDIELHKDGKGLGITVAGYICEKEDLCGIFVKSVIEGSMADSSGCIMVNDQIVEVDGIKLCGYTNHEAVEILKDTGPIVRLKIVRYLRGLRFQELQEGIAQANADDDSTTSLNGSRDNKVYSPTRVSSQATTASSSIFSAQQNVTVPATQYLLSKTEVAPANNTSVEASWSTDPGSGVHSNGTLQQNHFQYKDFPTPGDSSSMVPNMREVALTHPYTNPSGADLVGFQDVKDELCTKWEKKMGHKYSIVVARLKKSDIKSGLGISLEGTVDVEDGKEVRPHHYIRSILAGGPVGLNGLLKPCDELLEVNGRSLQGLFHEDVVRVLRELPESVCIVAARKLTGPSPLRGTIVDNVDTGKSEQAFASRKILSGSLQSLLALREPEFLLKSKSDVSLACTSISMDLSSGGFHLGDDSQASTALPGSCLGGESSISGQLRESAIRNIPSALSAPPTTFRQRSRSLEPLNPAAMWSSEIEEITLVKGEKGLGFSILDYQDPLNMSSMVIVVRSLVPGGVAQMDGRLVPGDRLMHVNNVSLEHASLDMAVQALKCAPFGPVVLGIAKPLNSGKKPDHRQRFYETPEDEDQSDKDTTSKPTMQHISNKNQSQQDNSAGTAIDGSIVADVKSESVDCHDNGDSEASTVADEPRSALIRANLTPVYNVPVLPHLQKFSISIRKAPGELLGFHLEALAFELCGTVVRDIEPSGLVHRDGRLRVGDLVLYLNHESLWRVTSSQAKIILRRAELVSTTIPIVFVPEENLFCCQSSSEDDLSETESASESLKLSELQFSEAHRKHSQCSCKSDEIVPDLTVESAVQHLRRFPSDLLESSVDPDVPSHLDNNDNSKNTSGTSSRLSGAVHLERDPEPLVPSFDAHQEDLTTNDHEFVVSKKLISSPEMVRIYNPPASLPRAPSVQGANGFKSPVDSGPSPSDKSTIVSTTVTGKVWGDLRSVEVHRLPGKGLGISIVSGRVEGCPGVSGIFIKNVLPDSPAGKTGQLFTGDRLVEVGGVQLNSDDQNIAVEAIKNAGNPVTFVVQSLQSLGSETRCEHRHQNTTLAGETSSTLFLDNFPDITLPKFDLRRKSELSLPRSPNTFYPSSIVSKSETPSGATSPSRYLSPTLTDNPFQNDQLPVWQDQIPVHNDSRPRKKPEVIEPEVASSPEMNQHEAYHYGYKNLVETPASPELAQQRQASLTSNSLNIKSLPPNLSSESRTPEETPEIIQAGLSDVERQTLQQKIQAEIQMKKEEHLTVYKKSSLDKKDEFQAETSSVITKIDEPEHSSKRPKAKKLKSLSISDESEDDEDPDEKINRTENFKVLSGDVIEVEIHRNKYGLGMALAGHRDRNRMGTFICGIHPDGPVAQDGRIMAGDELLKIHNTVVRGRSHLNVSAIIKKIPHDAPIRILVLRSDRNQEKVAIKNFNHFPLLLDEVIFASPEFEEYKARRDVKIQKTTEGLGIMIIEGSHKVLGKGIFISDIQRDSLAFKAELKVGDMILAVNTESFLTVSYEEAAMVLKQVTGYVRMLVVNPTEEVNKRNEEDHSDQNLSPNKAADGSGSASRSAQPSPAKSPAKMLSPNKDVPAGKSAVKSLAVSPAKTPAKSPGKTPSKTDPNRIELKKDRNGLGLSIVGGADTPLGGVIVHEVYKNGAADKDGRLQPGDRIVSVNGVSFADVSHEDALKLLRGSDEKVVIVIEPKTGDSDDIFQDIEVELQKKPGKGLGLSVVGRRDGKGVFISDMVSGGVAEANGQLLRGDQIMAVNDKDLSQAVQDQAVALLKTSTGNVKLKVRRYKFVTA